MITAKLPTRDQIEAAVALRARLPDVTTSFLSLQLLHDRMPGFGLEACLLKTVAVNSLLGTMLYATVRMANHLTGLLDTSPAPAVDPSLVDAMSALPNSVGPGVVAYFTSFASKLAHFFLSPELPMLDRYSEAMVAGHLGVEMIFKPGFKYQLFTERVHRLRKAAGLTDDPARDLDAYFWLTGQYCAWLKNTEAPISSGVRNLFEQPGGSETSSLVSSMVGGYDCGRPR